MKKIEYLKLIGESGKKFLEEIAILRIKVFYEFPYLYEGTLDYEKKYLETYFKAKNSIVILVRDLNSNRIVGASTAIWAKEAEKDFSDPFVKAGMDPNEIFYFGESVLLNEYRGMGIGKAFFDMREEFARSINGIKKLAFCAVVRPTSHPHKPQDYLPLDSFWKSKGFTLVPNLKTTYEWVDRGETTKTGKVMQFWMKNI
ncbi:MAG: GNAT family N-acetyltransferase [Bacteriovoracaceae bacterium]